MITIALPALLVIAGLAAVLLGLRKNTTSTTVAYLHELDGEDVGEDYQAKLGQPVGVRFSNWLRARLSRSSHAGATITQYREKVKLELAYAGLDRTLIAEMIIVAQAFGAVVGAFCGWLLIGLGIVAGPLATITMLLLAVALGWYPRLKLRKTGSVRSARIANELPDILELTSMGVTAGLSVDSAIEAVIDDFDGPLAEEFQRFLDEEALGTPRKIALERMRARTDVRALAQLVVTLSQADEMGMPVGSILRNTAAEARLKRQQDAREKAAKLPVKMLLPLVFCVFPPILVIIMGPAVATIRENLG